jgi:pimeloyl-ACP methyl ester carboxylesterase
MLSLDVNGATIVYEEQYGEHPPVPLVHGWCCDHSYLDPQFEHFAQLGRHIIAADLRGYGASQSLSSAIPCSSSRTTSRRSAENTV